MTRPGSVDESIRVILAERGVTFGAHVRLSGMLDEGARFMFIGVKDGWANVYCLVEDMNNFAAGRVYRANADLVPVDD